MVFIELTRNEGFQLSKLIYSKINDNDFIVDVTVLQDVYNKMREALKEPKGFLCLNCHRAEATVLIGYKDEKGVYIIGDAMRLCEACKDAYRMGMESKMRANEVFIDLHAAIELVEDLL